MEIIRAYQTKNRSYSVKKTDITPVGILVHSTGSSNKYIKRWVDSPERLGKNKYHNHWNSALATKSVHAWIGYDKDDKVIVAETLPRDRACWGCGKSKKGSYNYDPVAHIQFEICQGKNSDSDYYWKAITVAEEYCAYLCKMYGWGVDKITSHVEAHKAGYASNHADPVSWMKCFGDNMDKFRVRVNARISSSEPFVKEDEKTPVQKPNTAPVEIYTVQSGDTLYGIARELLGKGSRYKEIKTLNGLTSNTIYRGQKLKIPNA